LFIATGGALPALAGAPAALAAVPMPADAAPDILAGGALVAGDIGLLLVLVAGVVVIDDAAGVVDIAGLASPLGAAGMLGVPASLPPQPMAAMAHNPAQPKRSLR
jgi:hypothetical protein